MKQSMGKEPSAAAAFSGSLLRKLRLLLSLCAYLSLIKATNGELQKMLQPLQQNNLFFLVINVMEQSFICNTIRQMPFFWKKWSMHAAPQ
jgi:hypothetical protein